MIDAMLVDVSRCACTSLSLYVQLILERSRANLLLVQSGLGLAAGDHPAEQTEMQACSVSSFWIVAVGWMCASLNLLIVFF